MKRFLLILLTCLSLSTTSFAQSILWFRSTSFAIKSKNNYGNWGSWSDWQSSSVNIKMDLDNDVIVIYSPCTQIYAVVSYDGQQNDSSGGVQKYFKVVDQDYDRGTIRLRVERNGNSQLYVEFADVMWVYNVVRTN